MPKKNHQKSDNNRLIPKNGNFETVKKLTFTARQEARMAPTENWGFPAFDWCQNYPSPMHIFAFRDGLENTKIAKKNEKKQNIGALIYF